jgi:hypothetical protein
MNDNNFSIMLNNTREMLHYRDQLKFTNYFSENDLEFKYINIMCHNCIFFTTMNLINHIIQKPRDEMDLNFFQLNQPLQRK